MTDRAGKGRRGRARESKRDARAPQSTPAPGPSLEREPDGGIAESPAAPILSNRAATLQRFWDETNGSLGVQEETAFLSSTAADMQREGLPQGRTLSPGERVVGVDGSNTGAASDGTGDVPGTKATILPSGRRESLEGGPPTPGAAGPADMQRGEARQHGVEWLEGKGVGPAAQDVVMLERPSGETLRPWGVQEGISTAREALAALLVRGGYIRRDTADEWLGRRRG